MAECTIPALLAAIELLIQSLAPYSSDITLVVLTPCHHDPTSSWCYEHLAEEARWDETRYREVVTDVLTACREVVE